MLLELITDEIRRDGPIGFDRFMDLALYDPSAGYFATGRLRSDRAGDFLTSPEVSPLFGETIARFIDAERKRIGEPFAVIEVGGGSGSLLRPLLDGLDPPPSAMAIERSPAARDSIRSMVPEADVVDDWSRVRGVIVANELLDNMTTAVAVRRADGWRERYVSTAGHGLELIDVDPRPEVIEWLDRHAGPVPFDGQVEVQLYASRWVRDTLERLDAGALLVVDYGDLAGNLEHRRPEGTIRTYRGHHLGPDPLAEPGLTDITMDVNFSAVIAVAEESGADIEFLRQDEFLEEWGLKEMIRTLRADELKAARNRETMDRLKTRDRLVQAETLLHPRGLGDFRVLICRM